MENKTKYFILTILFILLGLSSNLAFAKEDLGKYSKEKACASLNKNMANKAYKILHKIKQFKEIPIVDVLCVSCKDKYVRPIVIEKIKVFKNSKTDRYKIAVNNNLIDINNTYIEGIGLDYKVGCNKRKKYLYQ